MRTYLSGDNSRGSQVTAEGGHWAHFRGGRTGIKVTFHPDGDKDEFRVYLTGGSQGARSDLLIGVVREADHSGVWIPRRTEPRPMTDKESAVLEAFATGRETPADLLRVGLFPDRSLQSIHQSAASLVRKGYLSRDVIANRTHYRITELGRAAL